MSNEKKVGDSTWRSIDYMDAPRSLPSVACCYVIYFNGEMRYVGSTGNLRNRFSGHAFRYGYGKTFITPWGEMPMPFDMRIKFKPSRRYGDWLMIEARLIRRLQPMLNSKLKGRRK